MIRSHTGIIRRVVIGSLDMRLTNAKRKIVFPMERFRIPGILN
jgi:hypothetical protein